MASQIYEIYLSIFHIFQHEKRDFVSPRNHIIFFFFNIKSHKTSRRFLRFCEDFLPFFEDFRRFSKIFPKARGTSTNIFRRFPKTAKNWRRLPKNIFSSYTNKFTCKIVIKIDIFTRVGKNAVFTCGISRLSICYHSVYHQVLSDK